jgi:hypothetical protein
MYDRLINVRIEPADPNGEYFKLYSPFVSKVLINRIKQIPGVKPAFHHDSDKFSHWLIPTGLQDAVDVIRAFEEHCSKANYLVTWNDKTRYVKGALCVPLNKAREQLRKCIIKPEADQMLFEFIHSLMVSAWDEVGDLVSDQPEYIGPPIPTLSEGLRQEGLRQYGWQFLESENSPLAIAAEKKREETTSVDKLVSLIMDD